MSILLLENTAYQVFYLSMHKLRIAANDGTDFAALSVESTKKQDVVDSTRPLNSYVRS